LGAEMSGISPEVWICWDVFVGCVSCFSGFIFGESEREKMVREAVMTGLLIFMILFRWIGHSCCQVTFLFGGITMCRTHHPTNTSFPWVVGWVW
jgi:hypothetical protein